MVKILLAFLVSACACGIVDPTIVYVAPEWKDIEPCGAMCETIHEEFDAITGVDTSTVEIFISYGDMPRASVIGVCYPHSNMIVLSSTFLSSNPTQLKPLMYHELLHSAPIFMEHTDIEGSLTNTMLPYYYDDHYVDKQLEKDIAMLNANKKRYVNGFSN